MIKNKKNALNNKMAEYVQGITVVYAVYEGEENPI